jgi:arabinose-5-phosphate isomerase
VVVTREEIIAKGKEVIRIEGTAVQSLTNGIDENFAKAIELLLNSKGRVILTGLGKSGLIGRKIVATLNSTGTASFFLHPTDALHGDMGMVRNEDTIIILSKSGNTEELLTLIPIFKRIGVTLIGILGESESHLAKMCDVVLNVAVKEEACPYDLAPTASTTAALVMGDALAITLLKMRGFTENDFALLHPAGSLGKRLSLKISEIMISGNDIPIVNEKTSLKDSILEITSKRLGMTCVINDDGVLSGIITDGDLRRLLERSTDLKGLTAIDVMVKNPKTIAKDFLASFALQRMEQYNITCLIVSNPKSKPEGVVHLHDLVKLGLQSR